MREMSRKQEYKALAYKEDNIIFEERLNEFKYDDINAVIASALDLAEKELK